MIQEIKVNSEKEAIAFVLKEKGRRGSKGWSFLPYDDIDRGLVGVIMFVDHCPHCKETISSEEEIVVQWPINKDVGELEPEYEDLAPFEFLSFYHNNKDNLIKSDAPKQLKIGFVLYDVENHKSFVKRIRINKIKNLSEKQKENLKLAMEAASNHETRMKSFQDFVKLVSD